MKATRFSVLILIVAFASGCVGRQYTLPQPQVDMAKYDNLGPSSQTATGIHLFGIIPIQLNNKVERATNAAIAAKGGDALTNVTVRERWYWAWVLNIYKVDVEGTVVRRK